MKRYKTKPLFTVPVNTDLVWAASAFAYRTNGGYARYDLSPFESNCDQWKMSSGGVGANQRLAHYAIMYPDVMSEDDYNTGKDMLAQFSGLIFKGLQQELSDFDKTVLQVVERKDWNDLEDIRLHFGVLCSLPKSYKREKQREKADDQLARAHSSHIGDLKQRLNMEIKVIRNIYSKQWETNYITALTSEGNVVYFSYKQELEIDKLFNIAGTVKAHRDEFQTQLNRVKVRED